MFKRKIVGRDCVTVRELIKILKKMPQEARVDADSDNSCGVTGAELYTGKYLKGAWVIINVREYGW